MRLLGRGDWRDVRLQLKLFQHIRWELLVKILVHIQMFRMQWQHFDQHLRKSFAEDGLLLYCFFKEPSGDCVERFYATRAFCIGEECEAASVFLGAGQEEPCL